MRKTIAVFMIIMTMLTPIGARAEINMTWSPDARDEVQIDFYARTNSKGEITCERAATRHTITYAPEQVTAKAYADHITVTADVTTAAPTVVIQWSTDKAFRTGVHVKTYQNRQYGGPVYCFLKYDYRMTSKGCDYVADRTFKQNDKAISYRHLESHSEWDDLAINYQSVTASRRKVACMQSYKVPVRYGRRYYVRVYLGYPGRRGKLYSRRATVKVR